MKNLHPFLQTKKSIFVLCCISASSIYFESTKRAETLSIYIFGPTVMSMIEHLFENLNIQNKIKTDKELSFFVYSLTIGMLLNCLVNEVI
jgi:hypothetical protein